MMKFLSTAPLCALMLASPGSAQEMPSIPTPAQIRTGSTFSDVYKSEYPSPLLFPDNEIIKPGKEWVLTTYAYKVESGQLKNVAEFTTVNSTFERDSSYRNESVFIIRDLKTGEISYFNAKASFLDCQGSRFWKYRFEPDRSNQGTFSAKIETGTGQDGDLVMSNDRELQGERWAVEGMCARRYQSLNTPLWRKFIQESGVSESAKPQKFSFLDGLWFETKIKATSDGVTEKTYLSSDGLSSVVILRSQANSIDTVTVSSLSVQSLQQVDDDIAFINDDGQIPFISASIVEHIERARALPSSTGLIDFSKPFELVGNWKLGHYKSNAEAQKSLLMNVIASAKSGSVLDMMKLFHVYLNGDELFQTKPSFNLAMQWLNSAARSGYSEAQNLLGVYYSQGFIRDGSGKKVLGTTGSNAELARFWLQKALEGGSPKAAENLAILDHNARVSDDIAREKEERQARSDAYTTAVITSLAQQEALKVQQEAAQRERQRLAAAEQARLQAQRDQTAAYERQQQLNRQAADQRAFEERKAAAYLAERSQQQQQQLASGPTQINSNPQAGTSQPGSTAPGLAGGTSQAQLEAERRRQEQLAQDRQRQQQLQAVKTNPNFQHRIERTQNGYAIYVTNPNGFDIQCQVRIDAYRWVGTSQQSFSESSPIYVSAGRENYVGWDRLQPVGARYSVSSCRGI